jgi:hypothetical protein
MLKCLIKENKAVQDSTASEFSRFERVEMKMTIKHDEMINLKIEHAVYRTDSVSDKRRDKEREQERRRERRRREQERRDRRQAVSK